MADILFGSSYDYAWMGFLPTERLSVKGQLFKKNIPLPLFVSRECD